DYYCYSGDDNKSLF
nr:immunoglobulin light chain junction region [Macaca mulatta]MOY08208.1 immunoglobulin light chain junction region [Macaca mulatta]